MAYTYATGPGDVVVDRSTGLPPVEPVRLTIWTARGGQQITAGLTDLDGAALPGYVESDPVDGRFPFKQADEYPNALWARTPGGDWFSLVANELRDDAGVFLNEFPALRDEVNGAVLRVDGFEQDVQTAVARSDTALDRADEAIRVAYATEESVPEYLENATLWSYGHSWTMPNNPYTSPNAEYQRRVASRLRLSGPKSFGISACKLPAMASATFMPLMNGVDRRYAPGGITTGFQTGGPGIVFLQAMVNDICLGNATPEDPLYQKLYEQSIRTFIASVSAEQLKYAHNTTGTSQWATLGAPNDAFYPGGSVVFTFEQGYTNRYSIRGEDVHVFLGVRNNAVGRVRLEIEGFGAVPGFEDFDCSGWMPPTLTDNVLGARTNHPLAFRLPPMSSLGFAPDEVKYLNVIANPTGASTSSAYFGGVSWERYDRTAVEAYTPIPPHIFIAREAPRNPAVDAAPGSYERFVQWEPVYWEMVERVAAQYPNVHLVDLRPGWNNETMISSLDGAHAHPNDLGMIHIADRFEDEIRIAITEPMRGVLTL